MARLTLDRLSMRFRTRRGESVTALQDISFEIKDREFAVLVGTSGCGKSTILRLVVDDNDKARELMVNNDFPYSECDVLAVEIGDEADLKEVLAALLEADLVDRFALITLPDTIGPDGVPASPDGPIADLLGAAGLRETDRQALGDAGLTLYGRPARAD